MPMQIMAGGWLAILVGSRAGVTAGTGGITGGVSVETIVNGYDSVGIGVVVMFSREMKMLVLVMFEMS